MAPVATQVTPPRRPPPNPGPARRVTFACPLCGERGRISTLVAEVEPGPPRFVTDLQGACEHAMAFGEVEGQTLDEAWTLIEAALAAASGEAG
jgi:hypothetical protein